MVWSRLFSPKLGDLGIQEETNQVAVIAQYRGSTDSVFYLGSRVVNFMAQ